jgi:hypothetical protein
LTPLAAATATLAVLALVYAGACWLRPFARCSLCSGKGCRWCRHAGRRLRLGRWAYNRLTELHRQAAAAERAEADR